MANNETYFSHFLSMNEAKAREYLKGSFHQFLVPATEVTETVQLFFSMELLEMSSWSEARSEHKVFFGAYLRLKEGFKTVRKSCKEV